MSTFIVEDGSGLPGANSYTTVAFADDYFIARGSTAWTANLPTTEKKQIALIKATDYIETRYGPLLKGKAAYTTREDYLNFPRLAVPAPLTYTVPIAVQKACAELALRSVQGTVLLPDPVTAIDTGGQVTYTRKKLGPLEKETHYATGSAASASPTYPIFPAVDALMRQFCKTGGRLIRD